MTIFMLLFVLFCFCFLFLFFIQLCAADVVYSVTALMEDVEASSSDAFFTALESLSMR